MSDFEHSSVTYTSVPSRVKDYLNIRSPEVDGPPSPDYVPGPEEPKQSPPSSDYVPSPEEPKQAPLSPDYVPGLEVPEKTPPSPVYLPYVPELVYPEYMPPEDDFFPFEEISPKDTEISVSPSSSVGSTSTIRSTISPLDYPFDESIFVELDNSLRITPRPLGEEPVTKELNVMPPKRTLTSETPAITLATIQRLITDGITAALETRAINTNNTNRNLELKETPVAKKRKLQRCAEEDRVTFDTGTLTNDALSWWNAYAQPIGIEHANKIPWTELKRFLTNKYRPQTEIKKMEDEFYDLTVKGNDLKTYIRRFQELATLCPNMVRNTEKLMEAFIGGFPRSIEGNVTASKPQTFEEAINIAQRQMDQIIKHNSTQDTNDHKQKFDDKNITDNNNYPNDRNNNYQNNHNNYNHNNDHHQQQNRKQETFKSYVATNGYTGNHPLCERCTLHHIGPCYVKWQNCNRVGHLTKNCRNKRPVIRNNLQSVPVTRNACGEKGHYANQCSKGNNRAT
nr:reverse transcriptase domain-containing protein [Tanacetum cinerariifolium]